MRVWLLGSFFGFLLAAFFVSALSTTVQFNASLETVTRLVQVDADFDFPPLLPGAEYSKSVTVRWALPNEALRDLKSDVVRVHVVAFSPETSWIVFQRQDQVFRAYAFTLVCKVLQGKCAADSQLQQTFQAVLRVPANASSSHAERFFVQASLFEEYPSIAVSSNAGFSQRVQDFLNGLPIHDATLVVQNVLRPQTTTPPASEAPRSTVTGFTVNVDSAGASSSTGSGGSNDAFLSAQMAAQPEKIPPGKQNISPIAGLVVSRDDAVFYGGTVVAILLAVLFYKRFLTAHRSNGLMEA